MDALEGFHGCHFSSSTPILSINLAGKAEEEERGDIGQAKRRGGGRDRIEKETTKNLEEEEEEVGEVDIGWNCFFFLSRIKKIIYS